MGQADNAGSRSISYDLIMISCFLNSSGVKIQLSGHSNSKSLTYLTKMTSSLCENRHVIISDFAPAIGFPQVLSLETFMSNIRFA